MRAAQQATGTIPIVMLGAAPNPINLVRRRQIAAFALQNRLPTIFGYREAVEAGGLMSYGLSLSESFRRVASYVDKILKGAKPADLPVEQPTKFELIVKSQDGEGARADDSAVGVAACG